jgi:gamma-glutamyltranspeptidase/glutathione hydrolase
VNANFSHLIDENLSKFKLFPATAALYMKDGKALPAGTLLRNPIWPRLTANWPAAASRLFMKASWAAP